MTLALRERIHQELAPIAAKKIDDGKIFSFSSEDRLCLQDRAKTSWEKTCEWFGRTFTSKMPRLKNKFEQLTRDFEQYLSEETDEARRNETIQNYGQVINEIYRCAERMKAARISGFANQDLIQPCLTRGPRTMQYVALPADYLIKAHLPKNIYEMCADQHLLPSKDERESRHEEQKIEGKAAIWIKLFNDPNQLPRVEFEVTPAKKPERAAVSYRCRIVFHHRMLFTGAYFDISGRDYVLPQHIAYYPKWQRYPMEQEFYKYAIPHLESFRVPKA